MRRPETRRIETRSCHSAETQVTRLFASAAFPLAASANSVYRVDTGTGANTDGRNLSATRAQELDYYAIDAGAGHVAAGANPSD